MQDMSQVTKSHCGLPSLICVSFLDQGAGLSSQVVLLPLASSPPDDSLVLFLPSHLHEALLDLLLPRSEKRPMPNLEATTA